MCEFSFSDTCSTSCSSFYSLVCHFFHVCFSIISKCHPLHFSYFIFFFPHFLSFISFLSPLFITTALLLLLSLLPTLPANPAFSHSKFGFLLSVFQTPTEKVSSKDEKMDEGVGFLEEFQAYLDVFQAPMFESPEENCSDQVGPMEKQPNQEEEEEDEDDEDDDGKVPLAEEKSHESNTKLDDMFCQKEDKEVKVVDTEPNKAEESREKMALRNSGISKVVSDCNNNTKIDDDDDAKESTTNSDGECFGTPERNWEVKPFSSSIGSYGSMRKEKELWRRTLAFKLYEERHSVGGSEGMDLLWETYDDATEPKMNNKVQHNDNDVDDDDDEEEDEVKGMGGKYCCLHALKFSAGKMNLGMRKPNFVKISKALKGIGLLHHVSKHGRKGYQ